MTPSPGRCRPARLPRIEAIRARDFDRAAQLWESGQQALEELPTGYRDAGDIEWRTGPPGRVDPAAGSRYIPIPVEVTLTTSGRGVERYAGRYVLRRAVVDGATPEQRRWRIYDAELERLEDRPE